MTAHEISTPGAVVAGGGILRASLRGRVGVFSVAVLSLVVLACVLAPWISPYPPLQQDLGAVLELPTWAHLMGTDGLGRDVLSRLLWGGRPALGGAFEAALIYGLFGVSFGLIAGYAASWVDRIISGFVDILMSLPAVVVIFAVLALSNNSLNAAMVTLGFFSSGGLVRVVRAVTLSVREELYVAAARIAGIGATRILSRHIAPRIVGPVVVQLSLFCGIALIVQSGLGYLNLGVTAPSPSWGGMLGEASGVLSQDPWLLVPSGVLIGLVVLACGLIGDSVRDANAENKSRAKGARGTLGIGAPIDSITTASRPSHLLEVDGLTISFETANGREEVVHGTTMEVAAGEIVGLVGESGSGKTVSALALLGLLPPNATVSADSIWFDGTQIVGAGARGLSALRGAGIGLISQEPMVALDPVFTIGSQLREVVRVSTRLRGRALTDRVHSLLSDVQLPDPANVVRRYPHELSGGMAQRVVIAIALAGNPKLLIADEPTTALDVTVQAQILDLLRRLRDERGTGILLVTHDLGVVADVCERAYVMKHGRVIEDGDVVSLFEHPTEPYTRDLLAATPSLVDLPRPSES